MAKLIDLKGKRFGNLLVIKRIKSTTKSRQTMWQCQCDCGTTCNVSSSHIGKSTFSCGCLKSRLISERRSKPGSAIHALLNSYKQAAKKRDLVWALTDAEFKTLTSSPCYYTGRLPYRKWQTPNGRDIYICNGIDRLDSSIGYTLANCVSCCKEVNYMKLDLSFKDFMKVVEEIYDFWKKG